MSEPLLRLRSGALDWRVIDDETVMLDADRSRYLATNASGTLLWRALADGATRTELVDALVDAYAIDAAQAAADADAFLVELRSRGLIAEP